jgi:hypothetical protein
MFLNLFPQSFLISPPRREVCQAREEAAQRSHDKSSNPYRSACLGAILDALRAGR